MEYDNYKYCRFCAEPRSLHNLIDLQSTDEKWTEIKLKLSFLNAEIDDNALPKSACYTCYDSLLQSYEFLIKINKARHILKKILNTKETGNYKKLATNLEDSANSNENIKAPKQIKQEKPDEEENKDIQYYMSIDLKEEPRDSTDTEATSEGSVHDQQSSSTHSVFENNMNIIPSSHAKNVGYSTWKDYRWVCALCNDDFQKIDDLRNHAKSAHSKCSVFSCIDCDLLWRKDDFNLFLSHVKDHRESLSNHCHYCDIYLDENLEDHIQMEHYDGAKLPCPICGEILPDEMSLKMHILDYNIMIPKLPRKKGTPIKAEDVTCEFCNKVFKSRSCLRSHLKIHTSKRVRNLTCDYCGKKFYDKGSLTNHILSHGKIRPYICNICNGSFTYPHKLKNHLKTHSPVKPFPCDECGKCFKLQGHLKAHKITHTDLKAFVCEYCNKAFRFKQILKNHQRQHTGDKPYSCQLCTIHFANWSNYNKHMKRMHGMNMSKRKPILGEFVTAHSDDSAGDSQDANTSSPIL